ncbi:MAG: hypothetical protein JNL74_12290 [Fibrobacteres bacterium]|nr:hypothetical protein [Fibrobacterota bacterium]
MDKTKIQLSRLIDQTAIDAVHSEIIRLAEETSPGFNSDLYCRHFEKIIDLYSGRYDGYRECNTYYHDLNHTVEVALAAARTVHGAAVSGHIITADETLLLLIAALLHDTGYIQTIDDTEGTGAKYATIHVKRSIDFSRSYCQTMNCEGMMADLEKMILSTELMQTPALLGFKSKTMLELANILGSADLLGQMANRCYLEKLLFLYYEFVEGNIKGYNSEKEMLEKTTKFYELVKTRLYSVLGNVQQYLDSHFQERWGIDSNLYIDTVEKNIRYLKSVAASSDHRRMLRRGNIVKTVSEIYT